jgi:hypothetical protein
MLFGLSAGGRFVEGSKLLATVVRPFTTSVFIALLSGTADAPAKRLQSHSVIWTNPS